MTEERAAPLPELTDDQIEAERQAEWKDALEALRADGDEQGEARFAPGSFGHHEALHTAWLLLDNLSRHLIDHPSVLRDPVLYRHAHRAHHHLYMLYQEIGAGSPSPAAESASARKLKALKPDLTFYPKLSRLRVFDPAVIGKTSAGSIGVVVGFRETPSLFDVSALQNELESKLGVKVHLAVEGMIQPAWESRIQQDAAEI